MNPNIVSVDAIILACWPSDDPILSQLKFDPICSPLADKPMLQRVVEKLVSVDCKDILLVLGDTAAPCRDLLGDGARWGCRIHYCYASANDTPLKVIERYASGHAGHCLVAVADSVVATDPDRSCESAVCWVDSGFVSWTGWANLSFATIQRLVATADSRAALDTNILNDETLLRQRERQLVSTADARLLINSQHRIFKQNSGPCGITRRPKSRLLWTGNGSDIHPSARLIAPVYIGDFVHIGEGATIGPDVVIGDGVVIDRNSHVQFSMVMPKTYIGENLEINNAIVSSHGLANVRLNVIANVDDQAIIGSMTGETTQTKKTAYWQRILALLMWLALWPAALALRYMLTNGEAVVRSDIAQACSARFGFRDVEVKMAPTHELIFSGDENGWIAHFVQTFHPGLLDVLAGKVAFVGLQARTIDEVNALPDYWRDLYYGAQTGLINETMLLGPDGAAPEMRYAGDALGRSVSSPFAVSWILLRYAKRLGSSVLFQLNRALGTKGAGRNRLHEKPAANSKIDSKSLNR